MLLNIEAERARKRLTKTKLADMLGISLRTYYNWLDETYDIPSRKLKQMADIFGVSMEYLLENIEKF